jgi:hypothetical protein
VADLAEEDSSKREYLVMKKTWKTRSSDGGPK